MSELTTFDEYKIPREVILAVEGLLHSSVESGDAVDCVSDIPIQHEFIPGAYARGMSVKAGVLLVGKIHRNPCFNFVLSGKCVVFDEGGRKDICGPLFFVSLAGVKRIIYVIEDLIWFNVHGTNETDLDKIEAELIAPSYADLNNQIEDVR